MQDQSPNALETRINVVANKRFLGVGDGPFDRMKLLRDIDAASILAIVPSSALVRASTGPQWVDGSGVVYRVSCPFCCSTGQDVSLPWQPAQGS